MDIGEAKAYLQQCSNKTGLSAYDHLADVVRRLLEQRPANSADIIESVSVQLKRSKFNLSSYNKPLDFVKAYPHTDQVQQSAQTVAKLCTPLKPEEKEVEGQIPDILDIANLFSWAGVTLGEDEIYLAALSISRLVIQKNLQSARLWGKIIGTNKDYIVVEAEGGEDYGQDETKGDASTEDVPNATNNGANEPNNSQSTSPADIAKTLLTSPEFEGMPAPKPPKFQAISEILPKEEASGTNKYIYYVCSHPGAPWVRLPDATPDKICKARSVKKMFSGELTKKIISHPPFNGTEAEYVRAQIARITAGTVVCPAGYYTFDAEENQDEETPGVIPNIIVNTEFEVLPNEALLNLDNWVHQIPYILPQGRTAWVNPRSILKGTGDGENNEDEEGNDEEEKGSDAGSETGGGTGGSTADVEPEQGPQLLTGISDDSEHGDQPAWSVRACSLYQQANYSPIHLASNRWPGAHAVYYNGKFSSIYVGCGLKDAAGQPFHDPLMPIMQSEWIHKQDANAEEEEANEAMEKEPNEQSPGTTAEPILKTTHEIGPNGDRDPTALWELVDPTVAEEKQYEEMLREKEEDKNEEEEEEEEASEPEDA